MKKILLRIILFFFSFFIMAFSLYLLFKPLYLANSVIFTFAITPFDIAKVYPKMWLFIKKTYFMLMFVSYTIIFNYLYSNFQKYFSIRNQFSKSHKLINSNFDDGTLKLLIGKNKERK